jgi:hypothetical protein
MHEDNIVRYPSNIGLTGTAINSKIVISATLGSKDKRFAPEVDNYLNVNKVSNILIGPMVDRNGEVKGVL